ncbi:MAG: hypothetical protein P0Y49_10890 [Candidatus Pedobacter colombiensis]|uniref:Uncharacterized protein n=1 Tax=Candidatus Pedobacter colombiensis TaxID=3121371 RepID=A0AAJ5WFI7_9SPHI|nr:hypothetical protein [Pedobacter sp.]WEK21642.1 MAG: hypothetical protein P0Y49_10890 [Pedobacter sp.]
MDNCNIHDKQKLITQYVIPSLGSQLSEDQGFITQLILHSRLILSIKNQQIETPGPFEDAYVWFSIDAMVHSYYFCPHRFVKKGTRIWKKREFILFTSCLLDQQLRTDYLEMLENGRMIFIKYAHVLSLMERYPELENQIKLVSINNERYYHNRNLMLNKPPVERVRQLIAENPLFVNSTSRSIQAMHVNLTRNGYANQLKKL